MCWWSHGTCWSHEWVYVLISHGIVRSTYKRTGIWFYYHTTYIIEVFIHPFIIQANEWARCPCSCDRHACWWVTYRLPQSDNFLYFGISDHTERDPSWSGVTVIYVSNCWIEHSHDRLWIIRSEKHCQHGPHSRLYHPPAQYRYFWCKCMFQSRRGVPLPMF